jgi:hypothetical protein
VAHQSGRRLFDYDVRFMNKDKLRRCMKELPWSDIVREQSTPEKRREFCQSYQIEKWKADDTQKLEHKLRDIFESKQKTKPKPKLQPQDTTGY